MNCPKCQTLNAAGAQFCMRCGAKFGASCSKCSAPLADGAAFCSKCGQPVDASASESAQARLEQYIPKQLLRKLEAARGAPGGLGERRVVTILFCDVKGSTAAAEKLDPEDWAEIMNGAFEHLIRPIYRYEGTLARLMGDAILAFFGAPLGHEDDPQRAIRAGLDIVAGIRGHRADVRAKWGVDFDVRVGINTGMVVVGEVGTDLRVEYTAMGDAVNLAARMEQTAIPGTVQIAPATHKLVAPLFDFETIEGLEVKGRSEPMTAYRVLGTKAQPGSLRGVAGLSSSLVGRDAELAQLRAAIEEVRRGNGQVVSVLGEAGLGKSRLVTELREALEASGSIATSDSSGTCADGASVVRWLEGRSLSYESSTPYAPVVDLLSHWADIPADQSDEARYAALRHRVEGVVGIDRTPDVAPFLANVMGIATQGTDRERIVYLEPPLIRGRVFQAIEVWVESLARRCPLVLVFEDLHWADATSLELLQQLLALTERASVAIVALSRPQHQEPSWRVHETAGRDFPHRHTSVTLKPLDEGQSRQLVENLLHIEDLPASVRALILAKAEGNPFFVEEVIRSLLDTKAVVRDGEHWRATRDISTIAIPDTLAGVLTARLDALSDSARSVLQTASVIGREFDRDTLSAVHQAGEPAEALDVALGDLVRRGLIREKSRLPRHVWWFKHGLTQDAAYGSLLLKRRRALHRTVGETLETLDANRPAEIARHFLEAHEPMRALPHLVDAAERAANAYASRDAIQQFEKALEILAGHFEPKLAKRAYEGLASALMLSMDMRGMEVYDRMLAVGREKGDLGMQISALNKLARMYALAIGRLDLAGERVREAARLARDAGDLIGLSEGSLVQCAMCSASADFEGAVVHLAEAERIGREVNVPDIQLFGLTHICNMRTSMLEFDAAWKTIEETRALAEKHGNKQFLAQLMSHAIPYHWLSEGDLDRAWSDAEAGVKLAETIGEMFAECEGATTLGQIALWRGEYERAQRWSERAVDLGSKSGMAFFVTTGMCKLGTIQLQLSRQNIPAAVKLHMKAAEMILGGGIALYDAASGLLELGFCALTIGAHDHAGEYFRRGRGEPSPPMLLVRAALLAGRGLNELARGNSEAALRSVEAAVEYSREKRTRHWDPLVAYAHGRVLAATGEGEPALTTLARAEAGARALRLRPLVWQSCAAAASVLDRLGRTDEARARRDAARTAVDEIAALIGDPELRSVFVEDARAQLSA